MSMKRSDPKKLVVKLGKKELRTVRDDDLGRVAGAVNPLCFESPPPTASS